MDNYGGSADQLVIMQIMQMVTYKQQPKVDFEPIYDKPKKEVKIDDLQRETKETRSEIGALKQNLQALQKTQSLESTSYQSNEESPSDNGVNQTVNPRTDTIQEPTKDLFLEVITRSNLHKWHSKVRIVISKDFEMVGIVHDRLAHRQSNPLLLYSKVC